MMRVGFRQTAEQPDEGDTLLNLTWMPVSS